MRVLVFAAALAAAGSVTALGVAPADAASAAACPGRPVPASSAQTSAAKSAFTADFGRIRSYLLAPTLENQEKMYARVDSGLFQLYSFQGGQLNTNNGHVRGAFTLQYKDGTQCFDKVTKLVSFQVLVRARFTSTNHHRLSFDRVAHVQMKPPKIAHYIDPVTR